MTRPDHPTGTDRIAEVVASVPCGIIVNVQGDEPLIAPEAIDSLVMALQQDTTAGLATLARRMRADDDPTSPHLVKVVTSCEGAALYFSRSPIPHQRSSADAAPYRAHLGLYAYRRAVLLQLAALQPTPLERAESLEQLRALEHGIRIRVVETTHASVGVDTPEDLERARRQLATGAPAA